MQEPKHIKLDIGEMNSTKPIKVVVKSLKTLQNKVIKGKGIVKAIVIMVQSKCSSHKNAKRVLHGLLVDQIEM